MTHNLPIQRNNIPIIISSIHIYNIHKHIQRTLDREFSLQRNSQPRRIYRLKTIRVSCRGAGETNRCSLKEGKGKGKNCHTKPTRLGETRVNRVIKLLMYGRLERKEKEKKEKNIRWNGSNGGGYRIANFYLYFFPLFFPFLYLSSLFFFLKKSYSRCEMLRSWSR